MEFSSEEFLCIECGLCCQGVFFERANIYTENDRKIIKKLCLPTVYDRNVGLNTFLHPCSLYDQKCTIYDKERPSACSGFSCELLNDLKRDLITIDAAINIIAKMNTVLQKLLPRLQNIIGEANISKPEILMQKILAKFPDSVPSETFKQEHSSIFMDYTVYLFLKKKFIRK